MIDDQEKTRSELIGQLYGAAAGPEGWPDFLENVAKILRANVLGISVACNPVACEVPAGLRASITDPGPMCSYTMGLSSDSTKTYLLEWTAADELTVAA